MLLLLVSILSIAYFLFYQFYWKLRDLPPGPMPWPFLGNTPSMANGLTGEKTLLKWAKKYGPIFTFWSGTKPIVMVADAKLMHEMFVKDGDNYADKEINRDFLVEVQSRDGRILFSNGDLWREHRRFSLHVLRNLGLGKNLMEQKILEEFHTLASRIDKECNKSTEIDFSTLVDISIGSIINYLLLGYRYNDDKMHEFFDLSKRAHTFMEMIGDPIVGTFFFSDLYSPIFKKLPYFKGKIEKAANANRYLVEFFDEKIREYRKTLLDNGNVEMDEEPTSIIQAFLQERRKRDEANDPSGQKYFNDELLALTMLDLWLGGQETTSNTLGWLATFLLHNPQVQQKAHEELDRVIGSDRLVNVSDKSSLPYISALINETLRVGNLVSFGLMRRVAKDTTVNGILLKAGTWIVPQISMIFYNPEVYPNPDQFKPERFLDSQGNLLRSTEELIPFSLGKRSCLGESLARMELFLFISNLLNQYKFSPGKQMPELTRHLRATSRPVPFKCHIEKRY